MLKFPTHSGFHDLFLNYMVSQSSFLRCDMLTLLNQMINMCFRSTKSSVTVNSRCDFSQLNVFFLFFLILKFFDDFNSHITSILYCGTQAVAYIIATICFEVNSYHCCRLLSKIDICKSPFPFLLTLRPNFQRQ